MTGTGTLNTSLFQDPYDFIECSSASPWTPARNLYPRRFPQWSKQVRHRVENQQLKMKNLANSAVNSIL